MAFLNFDPSCHGAKSENTRRNPLARFMREFEELVLSYETALLCSLDDQKAYRREEIRQEAYRLALIDMRSVYTRKHIRRSLDDAESVGKSIEEQLYATPDLPPPDDASLRSIYNGHFRLYSTHLFDVLGQPTDLRFGTLRFHENPSGTSLELALNSSFFVADSNETLPFHCFRMPDLPSPINRGILSRKPEDNGEWPEYDSWLLITFLGNGCLKVEIPVEMCADVYGGNLRGREDEEIIFWAVFVEDEVIY